MPVLVRVVVSQSADELSAMSEEVEVIGDVLC